MAGTRDLLPPLQKLSWRTWTAGMSNDSNRGWSTELEDRVQRAELKVTSPDGSITADSSASCVTSPPRISYNTRRSVVGCVGNEVSIRRMTCVRFAIVRTPVTTGRYQGKRNSFIDARTRAGCQINTRAR